MRCPICKEIMVPSRIECEDGSGWTFCWICGCNDELRNKANYELIYGNKLIKYNHHGNEVWVRADLQGLHRDYCLCYGCEFFNPDDRSKNCAIANAVYQNCVEYGIVTPMWECPNFIERL